MKRLGGDRFARLTFVTVLFSLSVSAQTGRDRSTGLNAAAVVRPLFDLRSPERSPFPSDAFTVADTNQNTDRRVNLRMPPDCRTNASDCDDVGVLNQLDGFNLQARISVPFDGEIDPESVTSKTVFLVKVRDALSRRAGDATVMGVNYIVWTPASRELSFRPDTALDQHTTYALVVTTGIRDVAGRAIGRAENVTRERADADEEAAYRRALAEAESSVRKAGVIATGSQIAALTVFTTQSFSHIVERMRESIQRAPAPTLNFNVGIDGARAVFADSTIAAVTNNADINVDGALTPENVNLAQWREIVRGAVGTVAFGTFRTLDFTTRPSGHVAPIPTRTGVLAPTGEIDVAFNLWLPAGTRPPGGWPVYIYAHGSQGHKNTGARIASIAAAHGLATITLNGRGRGHGSRTTMTVRRTDGTAMTFAAPGLGYDQNGDNVIGDQEPRRAPRPYGLFNSSGSTAQSAAQHFALVRALQAGVDVDGDGTVDLDGSRLYITGQSLGGAWGMLAFAYEPGLRAGVFVVPSATLPYQPILSPGDRPAAGADLLATRTPSLINSQYGLTSIDGRPVGGPFFNENLPLRDRPPLVNTVPGAIAIQRVIDRGIWVSQMASATAFAGLLRRAPPAGVSARPLIVQYARGDQIVTNPTSMDLIRAGDLADRASFYRHDLNFGLPGVPADPHAFFNTMNAANPNYYRIMLGAQHQAATFFESDGRRIIHPTPTELWEVPIRTPLPDDLFYLPRPR